MKILVTGARGMLGSRLMEVLREHDVTGWDREEIDITEAGQVKEKIGALRQAQGKPEVIINAAAYTDVDGAEANKEAVFEVNEKGVRNLAEAAKEAGAKMVHYSTDYVFPGDTEAGYREDDEPGPAVSVYGESKLAGERRLQEAGIDYYLVRTAWLYGPGGKNFVDTMLKLGQEKKELRVVDDQRGSPTFTKDLAEFTKVLLEEAYEPGVYHAVNAGMVSWYEFAQEIFRLAEKQIDPAYGGVKIKPVSSEEFIRPARRPQYSVLRNTRGPKMRPWQEALREYIKVYYKSYTI